MACSLQNTLSEYSQSDVEGILIGRVQIVANGEKASPFKWTCNVYFFLKSSPEDTFLDFREQEEGRERQRNIDCLPPVHAGMGIELATS